MLGKEGMKVLTRAAGPGMKFDEILSPHCAPHRVAAIQSERQGERFSGPNVEQFSLTTVYTRVRDTREKFVDPLCFVWLTPRLGKFRIIIADLLAGFQQPRRHNAANFPRTLQPARP